MDCPPWMKKNRDKWGFSNKKSYKENRRKKKKMNQAKKKNKIFLQMKWTVFLLQRFLQLFEISQIIESVAMLLMRKKITLKNGLKKKQRDSTRLSSCLELIFLCYNSSSLFALALWSRYFEVIIEFFCWIMISFISNIAIIISSYLVIA